MSFPNQLLTIMQQDKWNVRTKQNKTKQKTKNSHLEPYNHLQRVETKAQIFYVMPKKMQKNKTKKKRKWQLSKNKKTRTNRIKTDSSHS